MNSKMLLPIFVASMILIFSSQAGFAKVTYETRLFPNLHTFLLGQPVKIIHLDETNYSLMYTITSPNDIVKSIAIGEAFDQRASLISTPRITYVGAKVYDANESNQTNLTDLQKVNEIPSSGFVSVNSGSLCYDPNEIIHYNNTNLHNKDLKTLDNKKIIKNSKPQEESIKEINLTINYTANTIINPNDNEMNIKFVDSPSIQSTFK